MRNVYQHRYDKVKHWGIGYGVIIVSDKVSQNQEMYPDTLHYEKVFVTKFFNQQISW